MGTFELDYVCSAGMPLSFDYYFMILIMIYLIISLEAFIYKKIWKYKYKYDLSLYNKNVTFQLKK